MAHFGLTADEWVRALGLKTSDFDRGAQKGDAIIAEVMTELEAYIRSHLPRGAERLLRKVEWEWVVRSAYDTQATAVLGAPVDSANDLILWRYTQDEGIYEYPHRGDDYEMTVTTHYSLGGDKKTITFTGDGILDKGDRVLASYSTTLGDDCPTLRRILRDMLDYQLGSEVMPDSAARFKLKHDAALLWLDKLNNGKAILVEVAKIETLDEPDPQVETGTVVSTKRDPA